MTVRVAASLVKDHFSKHNNGCVDAERSRLYDLLVWELREVPLAELGIWDKAHGLPHEWCLESMVETVSRYREARSHDGGYHSRIQHFLGETETGAIIAVSGNTRRGREECNETRWVIDDGCMRAVAAGLKGFTHVKCYLGIEQN